MNYKFSKMGISDIISACLKCETKEQAKELLDNGESLETSEDYKINKVNESMNLLSRFCDENEKKIIVFSDR